MRLSSFFAALALAGVAASGLAPARAADMTGEVVRSLIARHKPAVVTLDVILKITSGQGSGDTELEVAGFVIDPSGLVVTTNTAIDPVGAMAQAGSDENGKMTSKVSSAKILTPDGDEVPCKVVLRDTDKNLAFLRPIAPLKSPMPFIDLKTAAKAQIGDNVYFMSRLAQVGNRATQVNALRLISVLEKPRLLYVPESGATAFIGSAAFGESGQPLGLVTARVGSSKRRTFNGGENFLAVIVPADDLLEAAAQAPQVKDVKDSDPTPAPAKKPTAAPAPGKKPVR